MAGTRSGDKVIVRLKKLWVRKPRKQLISITCSFEKRLTHIIHAVYCSQALTAEGFQAAHCIDGDILAQLSSVPPRNPILSRWSSHLRALVQNHPHDCIRPRRRATHKDTLRNSAYLHEIKFLRERRGSGGAKRALVFKGRENDRQKVVLGGVASVSSSSSALSPERQRQSARRASTAAHADGNCA